MHWNGEHVVSLKSINQATRSYEISIRRECQICLLDKQIILFYFHYY